MVAQGIMKFARIGKIPAEEICADPGLNVRPAANVKGGERAEYESREKT